MISTNGKPIRFNAERLWDRMVEQGKATPEDIEWRRAEVARQIAEEGGEAKRPEDYILPPMVSGADLARKVIELPEELISGMLHRGSKMVLGGGSKSFKTWCLADLAISIATGRQWWGREVKQGKVVYLNLEVQEGFFGMRLQQIAHAKGCSLPGDLIIWNLRGYCTDHRTLLPELAKRLANMKLAAIILDPTYKVMQGSENAQEEVAALMDSIEKMALATGAAVIFGSHFAKGNAAGKEAIDRISGSGVFARDPDAILTMTRHEVEEAFVIDAILRNCPPVASFVVRWEFPLMRGAADLDPTKLKEVGKSGRKTNDRIPTPVEVREVLESAGGKAAAAVNDKDGLAHLLMTTTNCNRENASKAIRDALGATIEEVKEQALRPQGGGSNVRKYVLKRRPERQ